jgi:LysM domain.
MPGIVSNCKTYHPIKNGDSCYTIDLAAKITLAQFRAWNTQVDATCSNLWLEYHVYIGV